MNTSDLEIIDISNLELLVTQQTEIIKAIYILGLYFVGVVGAIFVCFLLYKFIKSFY